MCVVVNVFVYQNMRSVTNERIAHENYYETKRIADSAESIFRELDFILNYILGNQPGAGEAMHIYIVAQDNTILFSNRQEDIFSSAETIPAVGRLMKDDSYDYTLKKTETGTAAVAGVRSQYDGITYVTISEFENYRQEIISIWSFIFGLC